MDKAILKDDLSQFRKLEASKRDIEQEIRKVRYDIVKEMAEGRMWDLLTPNISMLSRYID